MQETAVPVGLNRLVTPTDYISERGELFPSRWAWEWFKRQNRRKLVAAGGLFIINRREMLDPAIVDGVVLEVGSDAARRVCADPGPKGTA